MPRPNRKSHGPHQGSPMPRTGDFDLLNTVRLRTQRMLKSTVNTVLKFDEDTDVSTLTVQKDDMESKWDDFRIAFEDQESALIGAGNLAEVNTITQEYVNINHEYVKAKAHARKLTALLDDDSSSSAPSVHHQTPTNASTNSKLAPMRISTFSGNASEWMEFHATCKAVLNDTIPEIHRLQHLKDALIGEARKLVSHILPGDGAYASAMLLLKNRYENTRANGHLQQLYAIPFLENPTIDSFRGMLNTINGVVAGLSCCNINTDAWDAILIFHISQRFDKATLEAWEDKLNGTRIVPKLQTLLTFLEGRIVMTEQTNSLLMTNKFAEKSQKMIKSSNNQRPSFENRKSTDKPRAFFTLKSNYQCPFCSKNHLSSQCTEKKNMSVKELTASIKRNKLCANCFYPHELSACPFEPACRKCSEPHHSSLHPDSKQMFLNVTDESNEIENEQNETKEEDELDTMSTISAQQFYHISDEFDFETLLATAIVPTRCDNRSVLLKTLIDQGSTANLITIGACQLLRLKFIRLKIPMLGVGNSPVGNVIGRTAFNIGSIHDADYCLSIKTIVVKSIGNTKGFEKSKANDWPHLHGLKLADPEYHQSSKIDMLLSSSAHADFILNGVIKGNNDQPIAQNTRLGWIISGNVIVSNDNYSVCRHTTFEDITDANENLSDILKSFWELEEPIVKHFPTNEEKLAEEIFQRSITRTPDGKFMVELPFKVNPQNCLGDSFNVALHRYQWLQRKFAKNPELKMKYDAILEEYLTLNHMELVTDKPEFQCFLPHHYVLKESSTTTKVRAVFDGSVKTTTGISLNSCLCVGPVIQSELFDLLIRWRKFQFAVSADIEKMYRMINITPEHSNFHTILWHRPGTEGIAKYRLKTVTFGTSSAPYQATRSIHEIGERIKELDASLAEIIQKCFYVDDYLLSFPTIELACNTNSKLKSTLSEYGFNLRKWKSNDHRALADIPASDQEEMIDFDSTFKTLGISWQSGSDSFVFKTLDLKETTIWTKRKVLSVIAKLFDPLGWLAPCVIRAKILMQCIWQLPNGIDWDVTLPEHILTQWMPIFGELSSPIPITVPRWLKLSHKTEQVELHAFCDASNLAYACCIYLRVISENQLVSCNLVTAKTRVAPVRATSIPRLELCGAVLLSKVVARCVSALSIENIKVIAWCDSKIVLAWLATHPSKWTTFVSNRVSDIQQTLNASHWRHIPSKQNPADIASRGQPILELKESNLWWHGPSFLLNAEDANPNQELKLPIETAPEKRKTIKVFHTIEIQQNYVLSQFESYNRLLYFTCLALRWVSRIRSKHTMTATTLNGPIITTEINAAERRWIQLIQQAHFGHEMGRLRAKRNLPCNSPLLKLTPFIDNEGYLRMNGRVKNADMTEQKTSLILPAKCKLVSLIIRHAHQIQTLHGGVQLTLRTLREKFWIIHARNQVTSLIGHCMVCYRNKKRLLKQQMSDLPSFRTEQAFPFTFVGCDYAGPFEIKMSNARNSPCSKGYIVVFICMTTKAVHLELAGDQSTEECVMAFENMMSIRGIPSVIYSDNAGNFTGAEKEVHTLYNQLLSQTNAFTRMLVDKRITFKRIPAQSPHMGGIWERAVGLVKYHLKRVLKNTKLTHRRFDHLIKQIACCVNSRPLWAITPNADDIEVITPSHFTHFRPINTLPRPDLSHLKSNQLDQYQFLHRLYTDFWHSWSKEYLDTLQPRQKWHEQHPNEITVGHIVVIAEDNIPPSRWSLGRITKVLPASDGLIRSVEVKVGKSTLTRPIHRLGILPIIDNEKLSYSK